MAASLFERLAVNWCSVVMLTWVVWFDCDGHVARRQRDRVGVVLVCTNKSELVLSLIYSIEMIVCDGFVTFGYSITLRWD